MRLLLALACAASLSACSSDEEKPNDPPPQEPVPYDGPWAPLVENGEWEDPGALSACSVRAGSATCGDAASFDLSRCDSAALSAVETQGAIYRAELRYELGGSETAPGSGGFMFDAGGRPSTVSGALASGSQVGSGRFLVSSQRTASDRSVERLSFAGCEAPSPRQVTGCFVRCRDGQLVYRGTFRAERMTWRENETESSGLQLLSESRVERGFPADVYVTKGHAYVVSLTEAGRTGGLTVFDVSDPAHPVQTASLNLPNDGDWNGVWAKDDGLYIASADTGVVVYDIANPAQPVFVRRAPENAGDLNVHTVFVEGDRLYAMSPSERATLIFDITNSRTPRLLSRYALPVKRGYPHDAFAREGRLYVNHTVDGYVVADLTSAIPVELGRFTYGNSYSHANAVGSFNGRLIAFEGGETLGAHLRVLDVTHPAGIVKIGEYQLRGVTSIHNMVLSGTRLYVAYYHEGVRVLDVSEPSRPREIAYFNTFRETDPNRSDGMFEGAIGMRVPGDGRVYVVDTSRGLLIFNEP